MQGSSVQSMRFQQIGSNRSTWVFFLAKEAATQEVALERVGELSAMQAAVAAKLSAQSGLELSQQGATMQNSITALFEPAAGLQSASCFAVDERTTNEHISQYR